LIFPLRIYPTRRPVPSLRGGTTRPKPVIPLTVIGPGGVDLCQVLVDTGADDIVFRLLTATKTGISLLNLPQGGARGVGAPAPATLYYAPVILALDDGVQSCRWRATVAFSPAIGPFPLFGIAGGLEFFRTTLDVGALQVELIPKLTLPATQDPVP
jgi:hypothetical protein